MSAQKDVGMKKESVEYVREEIKLLEIQVALQKQEREVGLAEEALRTSYEEEVSALTMFWSWRLSMVHEVLRLLDEERELQEDVMPKLHAKVALSEERAREERESVRREREREREEREYFAPAATKRSQ